MYGVIVKGLTKPMAVSEMWFELRTSGSEEEVLQCSLMPSWVILLRGTEIGIRSGIILVVC
jgi:hypothetical protein